MMPIRIWLISLALFSSLSFGYESGEIRKKLFPDFESRFSKDLMTDEGQKYIKKFFKDMEIIKTCAPSDGVPVAPLTVYVEIREDGRVKNLLIYPKTDSAKCIENAIRGYVFARPPRTLVMSMGVNFAPKIGDYVWDGPFTVPVIKHSSYQICRLVDSGPSSTIKSPDNPNGNEFSLYRVYACGDKDPRKFVLWRLRHHKGGQQLVGEIIFNEIADNPSWEINKRTNEPYISFGFTSCQIKNRPEETAEVIYSQVNSNAPLMKRILKAWVVNTESKKLVPVPLEQLTKCIIDEGC